MTNKRKTTKTVAAKVRKPKATICPKCGETICSCCRGEGCMQCNYAVCRCYR